MRGSCPAGTDEVSMNIKIYPLERIEIDGILLRFGMGKADVENLIGKGFFAGNKYYYFGNEMSISYDKYGKMEYVEFLGGIDGILKPEIYGVSVFETDAETLVTFLKQKNNGEVADIESGHSYCFANISVGVYREMSPKDIMEMIEEIKSFGISAENNEDLENDKRKALYFATIGAGAAGYYKAQK